MDTVQEISIQLWVAHVGSRDGTSRYEVRIYAPNIHPENQFEVLFFSYNKTEADARLIVLAEFFRAHVKHNIETLTSILT